MAVHYWHVSSEDRALLGRFQTWGFDAKGWLPATREKYARQAKRIIRWLNDHDVPLERATVDDLRAFCKTTSPTTRSRNNIRQALLGFWDFLVDEGRTEENVAEAIPQLPERRGLPKALGPEQAAAIERAAEGYGRDVQALVGVFLYAGLRLTEARTLEWTSYMDGWLRFTGKGGKDRMVPLNERGEVVLEKWRAECDDLRWVFPSPYPSRDVPVSVSWVQDRLHEVGTDAEVPHLHAHLLRHTYATRLVELGYDVRVVQELLGHSSLQTTQQYLRVRPIRLQEAARGLRYGDVQ